MTDNKKDARSPAVLAEDLIFKYRIVNDTNGYMYVLMECDVKDIVAQVIVRCQEFYANEFSGGQGEAGGGKKGKSLTAKCSDSELASSPLSENGFALLDEWAKQNFHTGNEFVKSWNEEKDKLKDYWHTDFESFAVFCAGKIEKVREEERERHKGKCPFCVNDSTQGKGQWVCSPCINKICKKQSEAGK